VSDRRIWDTVTDDLPLLKAAIEAMIAEVEREDDGRYDAKKTALEGGVKSAASRESTR
jgi:hypothetical protein